MKQLPIVTHAEYRREYIIHIVFNDGVHANIDFSPWLDGSVFEPLHDTEYFRRFFLDGGTVAWPNSADIAPETLYEQAAANRAA